MTGHYGEPKPHKCPVCNGECSVFLGPTQDRYAGFYPCKACESTGIVWGPPMAAPKDDKHSNENEMLLSGNPDNGSLHHIVSGWEIIVVDFNGNHPNKWAGLEISTPDGHFIKGRLYLKEAQSIANALIRDLVKSKEPAEKPPLPTCERVEAWLKDLINRSSGESEIAISRNVKGEYNSLFLALRLPDDRKDKTLIGSINKSLRARHGKELDE